MGFKTSDFDYDLPQGLIAQSPSALRDHSRLLVVNRNTQKIEHRLFYEIIKYLTPGDLLILNNTKVFPARIFGKKDKTGGKVEIFLLKKIKANLWEALVKPGKRIRPGIIINLENNLKAKSVEKLNSEPWQRIGTEKQIVEFNCGESKLKKIGKIPLPPYINNSDHEKRYQTVYAKKTGASAAPTAGFHFTEKLLKEILKKGVKVKYVTLHTGYGTFAPIRTKSLSGHKMDREFYSINAEVIKEIKRAKRIIAVGTTSAKALESYALTSQKSGESDLFIYPGHKFKLAEALITNFHLPRSTLLALVSAFAGRELIMKAYQEAIKEKYRFYSFGDAMLIL